MTQAKSDTQPVSMPADAAGRKGLPIATGCLDYFPDALLAVAAVSKQGNDQHNPGQPLHWSRGKSNDHADTALRHFMERGVIDGDGHRHTAKAAWRMLATLQLEIEADRAKTTSNGWIEWKGGSIPVMQHAMVEYNLRCDATGVADATGRRGVAGALRWDWKNAPGDIVTYRVTK